MTQPGYTLDRDRRGLTRREREALGGLVLGLRQFEIAQDLGVSKQRAHQLVKALMAKRFVENRGDSLIVKVPRKRTTPGGGGRSETNRTEEEKGSWPG